MKYLYQMGKVETYVYDDSVNHVADEFDGILTLDIIKKFIDELSQYGTKYFHTIDAFALLQYFMERENVDEAKVIEKVPKFSF